MRRLCRPYLYECLLMCASLVFSGMMPGHVAAQTVIHLEPVLTGLRSPTYVTNAHDGSNRLFIVEQAGRIQVLQPGTSSPSVFLDITPKVLSGGERGLLGLAFHPQFPGVNRFFVNYTRQPDGATVIAEYHVSAGNPQIAEDTEAVILVMPQPYANHNGGMIEFGPDGYLYIGMGDGGSGNDPQNRAQNIDELLGKMLRIDIDQPAGAQRYSSPSSNPFFGTTPGRDEIYAMGFRNPWRFSFDRLTGELYVGDVGQGTREEIDLVRRGGNYGWRVYEGFGCSGLDPALCNAATYAAPIADYATHQGSRCAITGGYVYRGSLASLPAGAYVAGDYCSGEIFLWHNNTLRVILNAGMNIASFGEDEHGELYVVGLGGTVHWIRNVAFPNLLPNAGFEAGNTAWTDLGNAAAVLSDVYSGSSALCVGTGPGGWYHTLSNVAPNTSYALSGWGKVGAAGERGMLGASVEDSTGQRQAFSLVFTDTAYTQKGIRFTTPANAVRLYVLVWKGTIRGTFCADELRMIALGANGVLLDPGFEAGNSPWQDLGNTRLEPSQAHSGTAALQVGPGAGGRYQALTTVTANTNYTLSGWGKVGAAGEHGALGVAIQESTGRLSMYTLPITETVYTQKSLRFTTPQDTLIAFVWVWKDRESESFLVVDDVSLTTP